MIPDALVRLADLATSPNLLTLLLDTNGVSFWESLPAILREASKSPLGIFALMIVALAVLAFALFRRSPVKIQVLIFVMLFMGVVAFGCAAAAAKNELPIEATQQTPSTTQGALTNRFNNLRDAAKYLSAINADPATLHAAYTRDNKTVYVFPSRKDPTRNFEYTYDFFDPAGRTLADYDTLLRGPDIVPIGFDYHKGPPRFYYFKCKVEGAK